MTNALYLNNTYLFEVNAQIVDCGKDDKGSFVILNQTIFYPQGGGQPSDQGLLAGQGFQLNISMVRRHDNEIHHYVTDIDDLEFNGQNITCQIDIGRRMLNARYHTAAHLLGNIVEVLYPNLKAIKGHSFPKEAYVEFQGDNSPDISILQESINVAIREDYKTTLFEIDQESFEQQFYKLPYQIPGNKVFRVMKIGSLLPVPCGGTHLVSTGEIGSMTISKIKTKNNIVRISYEITPV